MIVNTLREEYEQENDFKYDYVMTTRFDLAFETDLIFKNFDNNYFYAGKWSAVFDQNNNDLFLGGRGPVYDLIENNDPMIKRTSVQTIGYPYDEKGLLDLWFFCNSDNSSKFYSLYKHLDEYNKPGQFPLSANSFRSFIYNNQLALRLGRNSIGSFTTGLGISWENLSLDYAFLNEPSGSGLGSTHLISVSVSADWVKNYIEQL